MKVQLVAPKGFILGEENISFSDRELGKLGTCTPEKRDMIKITPKRT